ncbi:MAG: hypothetical protein AAB250_19160 [Bdellovibrionota bacterium]
MKRRDLLKMGMGTGAALLLVPAVGCAQGTPAPAPSPQDPQGSSADIVLNSAIGNNHGHEVPLNANQALKLLRQTKTSGFVQIEIQGTSGHGHGLELTHQELTSLVIDGTLTKNSGGATHTHAVTLTLELK